MNRSSSVPNAVSGVPAPAKASRAMSRACEPTNGRRASDSPRSPPPWTSVWPPAWTDRPASAKLDRNTNNRHTTTDQKTTQISVVKSASISRDRARGSSLQSLIIARLRPGASGRRRIGGRIVLAGGGLAVFDANDTALTLRRVQLVMDRPHDEAGGLGTLSAA